jgi:hypothetical protein
MDGILNVAANIASCQFNCFGVDSGMFPAAFELHDEEASCKFCQTAWKTANPSVTNKTLGTNSAR